MKRLATQNSGVLTDEVTRTVYATDNSIYQVVPEGVAVPGSAAEIHELVRSNRASETPLPIVARGGGTGTNGQSLTDGLVVDLKRNLNRILEIDIEREVAIVEPGVVTAHLNAELAGHGYFWAPHTSTLNRATVGGMIATDAAGKGSLVYGRAHKHVLALEVCLDDGSEFVAEPVTVAEAERRAAGGGRAAAIWSDLLALPVGEDQDFGLPELARGFSGYGIDRLRRDGMIDPLALFVGAEGTLGIVTKAHLSLSPLPVHTTLVAAAYPSFAAALEDAVELRETRPTAIESFDERTLAAGRSSVAWPALEEIADEHCQSILLLEYTGEQPVDDQPIHEALAAAGRMIQAQTIDSPEARAQAWKVRADAVGLLGKVEVGAPAMSARPTAMVEDCAVPVASMVDFISDFRAVLDSFGVEYGMFGHADVGCVHVRPALDTTDPAHEALVRSITDAVVVAVKKHGGVLWGEHGRGMRGDVAPELLSPETIGLMEQVKAIFDPDDLFNPGKLYRPAGSDKELIALHEAPMRGQINRGVPVEVRREFNHAFACNGNGLCHQYSSTDVMCPSYTASGDPALSPRGRADLLRSYLLRHESGGDPAFEDAVADNLHQCLSCAACSGSCPVEVDIPELKSQFLERYYEKRPRPVAHALLSRFESLASLATTSPTLARYGTKPTGQVLGLVDLPSPKKPTRKNAYPTFKPKKHRGHYDLVLLRDVFTDRLEPDTILAAADVLESLGLKVALSRFVPSGKFDHVKGKRRAFAKAVNAQAELIRSIVDAGATPVSMEPAVGLLHSHEYVHVDPSYPRDVVHLVDVLHEHRLSFAGRGDSGRTIDVLGHCTERATRPESLKKWVEILAAAGYQVDAPPLGCCGMAGIFGHETENQEMSIKLWNLGWDDAVRGRDVVATGYSCRSQAHRLASTEVPHPIFLLS